MRSVAGITGLGLEDSGPASTSWRESTVRWEPFSGRPTPRTRIQMEVRYAFTTHNYAFVTPLGLTRSDRALCPPRLLVTRQGPRDQLQVLKSELHRRASDAHGTL